MSVPCSSVHLALTPFSPSPSQAGAGFWSNRVAPRYANAVSTINAAALKSSSGAITFALALDLHGPPGACAPCHSSCS